MPYRSVSPDQWSSWMVARVPELVAEVSALDVAIGQWSVSVPEGTSAPPYVVAMMTRRDALLSDLRALAAYAPR